MGVKGEYIDNIFNKIYAFETLIIEFDHPNETIYLVKELNRRVHRTEKLIEELEGEVPESRIDIEWIPADNWPKKAKLSLRKKEDIIKSFGFRIISAQDAE